MDEKVDQQGTSASASAVRELVTPAPGEPAILINGVPDVILSDSIVCIPNAPGTVEETRPPPGLGEWLVGREVRKWFMGRYYSGSITGFDKQSGWFRVLYEDGDSEDLDWKELEEVLLPLDVTIPLKTLAQRIVRKTKKTAQKSGKSAAARTQTSPVKRKAAKGQ